MPARYVEVPAIRGRVVDPDGQPAGGAAVRVVRDGDLAEVARVTTRADGTFDRPEQGSMTVQVAGADFMVPTYAVAADRGPQRSPSTRAYGGTRRWFFGLYDPPLDVDLGTLRLSGAAPEPHRGAPGAGTGAPDR